MQIFLFSKSLILIVYLPGIVNVLQVIFSILYSKNTVVEGNITNEKRGGERLCEHYSDQT